MSDSSPELKSHSTTALTRESSRCAPAIQDELEFFGFLTPQQRACLPNWLVVAPPKTGTSWLYANLREHPQTFVPPIKELKYFSHRFEVEDLRCYLDHFRDGVGCSKGEASPSYSMLPRRTIRMMRRLMPDLKLIYLMRDPIERAWSHARHSFSQGEANFKGNRGTIDDVTDDEWIVNLEDDWNRLSGDYLGQLQRWLSVFPREQVYVGFFEDLAQSPRKLFRDVLGFLDLDPDFAASSAVTLDAVNVGMSKQASPRVMQHLRTLYGARTAELADYLDREFRLRVPAAWNESFGEDLAARRPRTIGRIGFSLADVAPASDRKWEADDEALAELLARDDLLAMDYLGFHVVRRGESFMAYRTSLGIARPDHFDTSWWQEQATQGNCLFARNPYDLKSLILRQMLAREAPPGSHACRLRHVEGEFAQLSRLQAESDVQLTELQQTVASGLAPLDPLVRQQAETATGLSELRQGFAEFKQTVAHRLEPMDLLFRRQAEMDVRLRELRYDLAPLDPVQKNQVQLEEELALCHDQLREFQVQLRGARRRLRKLNKNRIIRFLRWLDVCVPWKRPRSMFASKAVPFASKTVPATLGQITVECEPVASKPVYAKPMLPSVEPSVISPADCLNSTS
jgi:Sulfotransferase domain